MTCLQLGGACELTFSAETFEEIAELSKTHGAEMLAAGDEAHLAAMQAMQTLIQDPACMHAWFDSKRREFETLLSEE
jgi:hypothetical protein